MTIQHIGQDFTTQVKLNLLPGITLKRGVYQMQIQYVTDTGGITTMHHMHQNMMQGKPEEFDAVVGQDVRYISVDFYCHNSFPTNPLVHYKYSMRIDHLILLNLAIKLIGQNI